jgi:hypothetical protein
MDILFNFQTTGFYRNTGENAKHSHTKIAENLGVDFPQAEDEDELVEWYENEIFRRMGWNSEARTMVSEGSNNWRYDLIFASKNQTAMKIIGDIYDGDLKNDVRKEVQSWREKTGNPQKGLTSFEIYDPEEVDDEQTGLGEFC